MEKQLEQEYYALFEVGDESELDYISEYETENTHYEVYYWPVKSKYVLIYGSYGDGFTDLCNVEFYDNKESIKIGGLFLA